MKILRRVLIDILIVVSAIAIWEFFDVRFIERREPEPPETQEAALAEQRLEFKDASSLDDWREHVFNGSSHYEVSAPGTPESALHATSRDTSSAIFHELHVDMSGGPVLSWQWKAVRFPADESETFEKAQDFVGKVYAIFKGDVPFRNNVIQYIWDAHHPVGSTRDSSNIHNVKVLVVRSGPAPEGGWVTEKRDLVKDYEKLYGKKADHPLVGIGFMTDSNGSKSDSEIYVKSFVLRSQPPPEGARRPGADKIVITIPNPVPKAKKLAVNTFSFFYDKLKWPVGEIAKKTPRL